MDIYIDGSLTYCPSLPVDCRPWSGAQRPGRRDRLSPTSPWGRRQLKKVTKLSHPVGWPQIYRILSSSRKNVIFYVIQMLSKNYAPKDPPPLQTFLYIFSLYTYFFLHINNKLINDKKHTQYYNLNVKNKEIKSDPNRIHYYTKRI